MKIDFFLYDSFKADLADARTCYNADNDDDDDDDDDDNDDDDGGGDDDEGAVRKCRWHAKKYAEFRGYSVNELGRHKLGSRRPTPRRSADLFAVKLHRRHHLLVEFDARLRWPGWIHPPTDQGGCGASWAFSTASQCRLFVSDSA